MKRASSLTKALSMVTSGYHQIHPTGCNITSTYTNDQHSGLTLGAFISPNLSLQGHTRFHHKYRVGSVRSTSLFVSIAWGDSDGITCRASVAKRAQLIAPRRTRNGMMRFVVLSTLCVRYRQEQT